MKKKPDIQIAPLGGKLRIKDSTASAQIISISPWMYESGKPDFILANKTSGITGDIIIYSLSGSVPITDGLYTLVYSLTADATKKGYMRIKVVTEGEAFKFTVRLTSDDPTFLLPCSQHNIDNNNYSYSWIIDWGDGVVEVATGTSNDSGSIYVPHTYTTGGDKQITIAPYGELPTAYGWLEAFGFNNLGISGCNTLSNKAKLYSLDTPLTLGAKTGDSWDGNLSHVGSYYLSQTFIGCDGLHSIAPNFFPNGITQVENGFANYSFSACTGLTGSINDILGSFTLSQTDLNKSAVMQGTIFINSSSTDLLTGNYATIPLLQLTPNTDRSTFYSRSNVTGYSALASNWK